MIADIRDLEKLTALTRALILRWDDALAKRIRLEAIRDQGFDVGGQLARQEQVAQNEQIRADQQAMEDAREAADQQLADSIARVQDAAALARREHWKGEVATGLAVLRASYDVYASAEADLSRQAKTTLTVKVSDSRPGKPARRRPEHIARNERLHRGPSPSGEMPEAKRLTSIYSIQKILRETAPASKYRHLVVGQQTLDEAELEEASAELYLLDVTDPHNNDPYPSTAPDYTQILQDVAEKNWTTVFRLISSTRLTPDTLDSRLYRNDLRKQLSAKLATYLERRAREGAPK